MRTAENIEKLIKKLKFCASPELDESVHRDISRGLQESEATKPALPGPNIWRTIMKNKITKLATAAVVITVVLIGINQFSSSTNEIEVAKLVHGPQRHSFNDGSTVKLAEGAEIRLYNSSEKRGFEHLAGEIEVTVAKGKGKFVVVTSFGAVKALGTVFEIDLVNTNSIDILAVEVKEGSVEVSNPQGSKVIKANQGVTVERDKAPYDFRQDENLSPRLIERIQLMLDAFEAGDKKAWAVNFNIQAFFDLVKGNIKDWRNHPWFSKFSEDRIAQFKQMGADITGPDQLLEMYISSININESSKRYILSVVLDDDGKLARADCVKVEGHKRYVITTPQWAFFDGDWWQIDD